MKQTKTEKAKRNKKPESEKQGERGR